MNRYHQTCKDEKSYQLNMKLLQYDLLYGSHYAYGLGKKYESTDMQFGVKDITIGSAITTGDGEKLYFIGDGFTQYTDIYVNGKPIDMDYLGPFLIRWKGGSLEDGDEVYIIQRSKTNQRPVLWKSPTYVYRQDSNLILED